MHACLPLPNLAELYIDFDFCWKGDDDHAELETLIEKASLARFSNNPTATKIRALRLPSMHIDMWDELPKRNPLPLLLLKSNLLDLRSCEIPWFDRNTDPEEIERVVRERCPNLKHLTCPTYMNEGHEGAPMSAFIRGCSGLQTFSSDVFNNRDSIRRVESQSRVISELALSHYSTLEDFALTRCHQVLSQDLQLVLSRCKRLKRFWVESAYIIASPVGVEFLDICKAEWACMELTTLRLTLNRFSEGEDATGEPNEGEGEGYSMADAAKRAYGQIGRLEKLETLLLDINCGKRTEEEEGDIWDVTLSHGWLREWAGLKNLKRLTLKHTLLSAMGQAEVEFMHENWPPVDMPKSAAESFFTLSELILPVSAHLTTYDLAQCSLVCQEWSRLFEPSLWANFCPKKRHVDWWSDTSPSPLKAALMRNLPHLRTVKTSVTNTSLLQVLTNGSTSESSTHQCSTSELSTRCTNLKRLELNDSCPKSIELSSPYLARLLMLNPRLTHLELPFQSFVTNSVLTTVPKLKCLQHLSIYSSQRCSRAQEMLMLLQACLPLPNLAELFLKLDYSWEYEVKDDDLKTVVKDASKARFSNNPKASKIRSLQLPSLREGMWPSWPRQNVLPLILLKSNLLDLESCEIPWFDKLTDPEEIERVVQEHCPNLRHLTCPSLLDEGDDGSTIRAFIRGCSGLQSFSSDTFSDRDWTRSWGSRSIISELVSFHHSTLEDFVLTNCHQVFSHDLQSILSRCKKLKRLWVEASPDDGRESIAMAIADATAGDWVCKELTELRLTLNRHARDEYETRQLGLRLRQSTWEPPETYRRVDDEDDEDEEDGEDDDLNYLAQGVYRRIGRLEKLEHLKLDIDTRKNSRALEDDYKRDLTLSHGWLRDLAGLKRLKMLTLKNTLLLEMGQAEVEFIYEHWPLLSQITVYGEVLFSGYPWDCGMESQWKWLRTMPPATIYSVLKIHELTAHIACYLTFADVASAMMTCKALSKLLQPFLWARFCPKNKPPDMSVLAQNLHHIRSIDLQLQLTSDIDLETLLRTLAQGLPDIWHLRRLKLSTILDLTSQQTQELHGIDDAGLAPLVLLLSAMVRLQHLTIRTSFQSEIWFMAMLRACLPLPRLSELYCHFFLETGQLSPSGDAELDYEDWDYDIIATPMVQLKDILDSAVAARTSVDGSIGVKIKALRFPDPEEADIDLIRLVLPMLNSDLVEIETLEVPNHFIRAATGLKTLRGFRLSVRIGGLSMRMIETLVKHHAKTLEEVELMSCKTIMGHDQQALFTSCKQLKRFWMVPDGDSDGLYGIDFRFIITGAWNCLGMRELSLTLNRSIDVQVTLEAMRKEGLNRAAGDGELEKDEQYREDDEEQRRRATAWAAKQAFTQIGRLTALEHLALGTDEDPSGFQEEILESRWDLTLSKGWLAQVVRLKKLRHFHMSTDHWSHMGQAEVESMVTEWPLLDHVTFDRCSMSTKQFLDVISLPHWQWLQPASLAVAAACLTGSGCSLQRKRPSLLLSAIDMCTESR
ncbi:hypothetical protein EC968_009974 [Mortierella alpina]|nr:hypothetical protein EC968_009974 [Mortierella alpina]